VDTTAARDFTETIKTLAGLSKFIIADITNPTSSPFELHATMPDYMIPFVAIIHDSEEPFAMFRDLKQKYGDWVLDVLACDSVNNLIAVLEDAVVAPALALAQRLTLRKVVRHVTPSLCGRPRIAWSELSQRATIAETSDYITMIGAEWGRSPERPSGAGVPRAPPHATRTLGPYWMVNTRRQVRSKVTSAITSRPRAPLRDRIEPDSAGDTIDPRDGS
jgi:hypothetical protein